LFATDNTTTFFSNKNKKKHEFQQERINNLGRGLPVKTSFPAKGFQSPSKSWEVPAKLDVLLS
jgi:hypothetical protein